MADDSDRDAKFDEPFRPQKQVSESTRKGYTHNAQRSDHYIGVDTAIYSCVVVITRAKMISTAFRLYSAITFKHSYKHDKYNSKEVSCRYTQKSVDCQNTHTSASKQ
jgi:hypothetical protein